MQGRWAILRLMIESGAVDIHVRARVLVRCLRSIETVWKYDAAASSGQGSLLIHLKKDMLVVAKEAVGRCG
jgi:hypothetical protein